MYHPLLTGIIKDTKWAHIAITTFYVLVSHGFTLSPLLLRGKRMGSDKMLQKSIKYRWKPKRGKGVVKGGNKKSLIGNIIKTKKYDKV